jgi:hypothetical protein
MVEKYGLWPGVIAMTADADMFCVVCAMHVYGEQAIMAVVDGVAGYEQCVDHEGNPFGVVLYGSEDLHKQYCGRCHQPLCEEGDCWCYSVPDAMV